MPADYGVLAVLMSIVYIFSVPNETIQTVISRYTSKYLSKKQLGKIKVLLFSSIKKAIKIAFLFFLAYIFVAFFLSSFLKIDLLLIILTGFILFAVFIIPINRGILQGSKRFKELGFNMIIESVIKLILAVLLVYVGMKVYGAISGLLIGMFFAFFLAFFHMKEIIKSKNKKINTSNIYSYGKPVFIVMVSIVLMYSLDIILAKRFFSPEIAGQYAVASMLGKMIFFGTLAISKAMFPLASEKYETGDNSNNLLYKSLLIISFMCISGVLIFGLFPKFIIALLFGSQYISISSILVYVGIAFSLLSIANLIATYNLRSHKIKSGYFLFVFVLIEILLLSLFRQTLKSFSIALGLSCFLMLIGSLIFLKIKER